RGAGDMLIYFFFQAEDGIRDWSVTGVQTCALPIFALLHLQRAAGELERRARGRRRGLRDRRRLGGGLRRAAAAATAAGAASATKIGRASCRERVQVAVVGGTGQRKKGLSGVRRGWA